MQISDGLLSVIFSSLLHVVGAGGAPAGAARAAAAAAALPLTRQYIANAHSHKEKHHSSRHYIRDIRGNPLKNHLKSPFF